MRGNPVFFRIALLVAAAAIVPACGGSSGGALPVLGGTTVFSDNFNQGTAPVPADWTSNANGGTITNDGSSVVMTGTNPGDDPSITTIATFTTPTLTISVTMAFSGTAPLKGAGEITILDGVNGLATATVDSANGNVTFAIGGDSAVIPAAIADANFHTFVFKVDAAGSATWTLDGGAADVTGSAVWTAGTASLSLGVDMVGGGSNPATFNFGGVSVTTP